MEVPKSMSYNIKNTSFAASSKKGSALLQDYWWVFLFVAICFSVYIHATCKKRETIQGLETYLYSLKSEKQRVLEEKEELMLNIDSQKDPAWIELTLMKGLGLVPEGTIKVYFDTHMR